MKTAVIYARYSSDNQTEQSIDGQLRVCNDYAKNNDIVILDTYIDRAMTGTNDNRPDFQRMIRDSYKKEWDYVLVYKLDRFSRNKYEMAMHKKTLKDNGVKVISAMEYIPDSPEAIILESMLEGYAEYYSAELSQKVKRGLKETRIKGNFTGGYLVYGYTVSNRKITINEEQAEVIRYIYKEYSKGKYVKNILEELEKQGVQNKGKPFARTTIYNILRNEKYSGIYRFNGEIFDNMYPRIVPKDIFDIVRGKAEKNFHGKNSVKIKYLLKGKLKCAYCGENINAESGTNKKGKVKKYYKCMGRKLGKGCKKEIVRKDILENLVIDNVIQALSDEKTVNSIVNYLIKLQDKEIQGNETLNRLLKQLQQTEIAINNIMSAIEMGGSTNTAMKRIRELEDKQETLNRNILIEKSKTVVKLTEKEIRQYYKQALTLDMQNIINILIKEIKLYDDKMIIVYKTPLQTSPDESQGFCFIQKKTKMPILIDNNHTFGYREFEIVMTL